MHYFMIVSISGYVVSDVEMTSVYKIEKNLEGTDRGTFV
jgi:hypothetical protein